MKQVCRSVITLWKVSINFQLSVHFRIYYQSWRGKWNIFEYFQKSSLRDFQIFSHRAAVVSDIGRWTVYICYYGGDPHLTTHICTIFTISSFDTASSKAPERSQCEDFSTLEKHLYVTKENFIWTIAYFIFPVVFAELKVHKNLKPQIDIYSWRRHNIWFMWWLKVIPNRSFNPNKHDGGWIRWNHAPLQKRLNLDPFIYLRSFVVVKYHKVRKTNISR